MDLPIQVGRFNHAKRNCHATCLKSGVAFFTSLTKLLLEAKASVCSTIKENLLLYCCKFWEFFITIII